MKSTLKMANEVIGDTYPCIGVNNKLIVLFNEKNKGTVLSTGDFDWDVGDYYDNWDIEGFIVLKGSVTLSN